MGDQLHYAAKNRAAQFGYSRDEDFVDEIVMAELFPPGEDLSKYFALERLAHIDAALKDIEAANFYTEEEVDDELAKRRAEWIRKHPK